MKNYWNYIANDLVDINSEHLNLRRIDRTFKCKSIVRSMLKYGSPTWSTALGAISNNMEGFSALQS